MTAPETGTEDEDADERMSDQAYAELLGRMTSEEVRARALGLTKTADAMREVIAGFVRRHSTRREDRS